jgi:hypothetical protein
MNTPKTKLRVLYRDMEEKWLEVATAKLERDAATLCRVNWLRAGTPVTGPLYIRNVSRRLH